MRNMVGRFSAVGAEVSGQLEDQPQVPDVRTSHNVDCYSQVSDLETRNKPSCRSLGSSSKMGLEKFSEKSETDCSLTKTQPKTIDSTEV